MQTIIDIVNQIKSTVKPMFDEREVSAFKFFRELNVLTLSENISQKSQ